MYFSTDHVGIAGGKPRFRRKQIYSDSEIIINYTLRVLSDFCGVNENGENKEVRAPR